MIRSCLLRIERRLSLANRYGIPFRTAIPDRTRLGRGVCCEKHWRMVCSSWLQWCLLRSCCRGRLAKSYTEPVRQSRLAFWLGFPNLHQRRLQSKILPRQWRLRLCYRKRQMWLRVPRINQRRTLRQFPIRLKLHPRIFNRPRYQMDVRRPRQRRTLSRPLPQQARFRKRQLRTNLLRPPDKLRGCTTGHYRSAKFAQQKETRYFDIVASPGFDARPMLGITSDGRIIYRLPWAARGLSRPTRTKIDSLRTRIAAFQSSAMRCLLLHLNLGRIIFPTIRCLGRARARR